MNPNPSRQPLWLACLGLAAASLGLPAAAQVDPNRMVDTFERVGDTHGLNDDEAKAKGPDVLFDDRRQRAATGSTAPWCRCPMTAARSRSAG